MEESFAPQCRCSPKLPEGADTVNDETRVKQHFAEAEETSGSVCTSTPRLGLFTPFNCVLLLTEPPMCRSSSDSDICQIGIDAYTYTRAYTEQGAPSPSSPEATLREMSKISLNKEASGDKQTVPAPPSKQGETRVGRGRVGVKKRARGCTLYDHNPIPT